MNKTNLIKYVEIHGNSWQNIIIPSNANNIYIYNINEHEDSIAEYEYKDDCMTDDGLIEYAQKKEFIDTINKSPSLSVKGDIYIELVK